MFDLVTYPLNSTLYRYLVDLEIKRAVRYSRFFSVCHIALDQNCTGDAAILDTTADIIREIIRDTDVLGRLGDGIFSILLHNTEIQNACLVANRIRNRVAEQTFISEGAKIRGTASIGSACFPTHSNDPAALLLKADEMLEVARLQGGNTVVIPE